VVRLTPLAEPLVRPEEIAPLRVFVTACFSKRRKQLKNAVPDLTVAQLRELGLDPTIRPERLPPEMFVRLLRQRRSKTHPG
jgi:16S rRNA (adenine1518-N6/adenine1519-N6)-dimethyltransferase